MYPGSVVKRKRNPRQGANILKVITHYFTYDIFRRSSKRVLQEDDIYEVLEDTRASRLGDAFEGEWKKEKKNDRNSLMRAIIRLFGKDYMFLGFLNFIVRTLLMTIKPVATGKMISYFSPNTLLTTYDAYYYASIVVGCIILWTIFSHYYHLMLVHLGVRLRVALCSLMYRKSLKMSMASFSQITSGKIVTMMSKDMQIFEGSLIFVNDLWLGSIQLFIMGYVMYQQIQISAVIGMALLFMFIPIQLYIGMHVKRLRLETATKTDERLRRIQEILTSIKLIKLYTWDKYYTKITNSLRSAEISKLRKLFYLNSTILAMSHLSYRVSQYASIRIFIHLGNILTTEKVFVVVTCYGSFMYLFTYAIPKCISAFADTKSCLKRIKQYLLVEEIHPNYSDDKMKNVKISLQNAGVKYLAKVLLKNVNFEASSPRLIGITGAVGSGKSTFLKMVLSDVKVYEGEVVTNGEMSYASQEPWLFPETIKANILFGQPYDPDRYRKVIQVCALEKDLEVFPKNDETIVSDKGLNLSKGQQARVNLARAIYRKSDIYLLDDVMTALDSKVSKQIFDECLRGFLKDKLCFLICHNKKFLKDIDRILVFDEGTITADGTYDDLNARNVNFGNTVSIDSAIEDKDEMVANLEADADEDSTLLVNTNVKDASTKIYGEHKESGKVKMKIYKKLFYYAGGWKTVPLVIAIFLFAQWSTTYFDFYISKVLKAEERLSQVHFNVSMNYTELTGPQLFEAEEGRRIALINYTVIITLGVLILLLEFISWYGIATKASKRLHLHIFEKMMGATMYFFDTHLSGNILNRFSKDMGIIDDYLPVVWFDCIRIPTMFVFVIGVIVRVNPIVLAPCFLVFIIMLYFRSVYLRTSRNLWRLNGITRAPFIGYLNSSLEGLTTIRATRNQDTLIQQFNHHLDVNSSASYMCLSTAMAFGFWLGILGDIFISFIIYSFIMFNSKLDDIAGDIGVAVTQALSITNIMHWAIRQWAELENTMTSVERVTEYSKAEQEDGSGIQPTNWPKEGSVEFQNVTLRYPNSNKIVLDKISFAIKPREKVGIVGRTGAGKSSIISVLFRLYPTEGAVIIDGVNTSSVGLETIRSKISIIPQDPVLFEGSIRTNLDPNNNHTDLQLWNVLREVELKTIIDKLPLGLDSVVEESGSNWTVGQRQLFCLARAILRNNKILVMDEATANIDQKTNALIQKTVRRVFKNCTILTIAHSLGTIIDSDRIMVIDFGKIVEFDEPQVLLNNTEGRFYGLVKQAAI